MLATLHSYVCHETSHTLKEQHANMLSEGKTQHLLHIFPVLRNCYGLWRREILVSMSDLQLLDVNINLEQL